MQDDTAGLEVLSEQLKHRIQTQYISDIRVNPDYINLLFTSVITGQAGSSNNTSESYSVDISLKSWLGHHIY
jgi:hypothetical protein